jgi:hypothetical protein
MRGGELSSLLTELLQTAPISMDQERKDGKIVTYEVVRF